MNPVKFDSDLDAVGLLCPLPVLKARKRLSRLASGQVLRMRTSDPAAIVDVPHYCVESGHQLLASETNGSDTHFYIRKK